jgi:misacylated tRNA(Ala) deacylase
MEDTQWRTHRLELDDQTLREWDARVLAADAEGIVLDRSAFYPGGGGQPPDHGVLLWGGARIRACTRCAASYSVTSEHW